LNQETVWQKVVAYQELAINNPKLIVKVFGPNQYLFVKSKYCKSFEEEKYQKRLKILHHVKSLAQIKELKQYVARFDYFRHYDASKGHCDCSTYHRLTYCKHKLMYEVDKGLAIIPLVFTKDKVNVGEGAGRPQNRGPALSKK